MAIWCQLNRVLPAHRYGPVDACYTYWQRPPVALVIMTGARKDVWRRSPHIKVVWVDGCRTFPGDRYLYPVWNQNSALLLLLSPSVLALLFYFLCCSVITTNCLWLGYYKHHKPPELTVWSLQTLATDTLGLFREVLEFKVLNAPYVSQWSSNQNIVVFKLQIKFSDGGHFDNVFELH